MKKIRIALGLTAFLLVAQLSAHAQMLQLLPPSELNRDDFKGGFYVEFTPLGNLFYEIGNQHMRNQLEVLGLPNGDRFRLDMFVRSFGYWRKKWIFQFDYFTRQFTGNPAVRSQELGENQYFFNSLQNRAIQMNVGYRISKFNERNDLYLKLAFGQHWNTIGLGITGANATVDMTSLATGPVYVGLPLLRQSSNHLDFSIEIRSAIKRRLEVLDGLSIGCRYGLGQVPWQALNSPTINAINDRSVIIYSKISIGLRLNKEK
ncbi:MAG: hypothetical protein ACK417_09440 [Bacteroidia bacterium]